MTTLSGMLTSLVTTIVRYQQLRKPEEEGAIVQATVAKSTAEMMEDLNHIIREATQIQPGRRPLLHYLLWHIKTLRELNESQMLYTNEALSVIAVNLTEFMLTLQRLYELKKEDSVQITLSEHEVFQLNGFITTVLPVINMFEFYCRSATILRDTLFKELACELNASRESILERMNDMLLLKWNKLRADTYASVIESLKSEKQALEQQVLLLQQENQQDEPVGSIDSVVSTSSALITDTGGSEQMTSQPLETTLRAKKSIWEHLFGVKKNTVREAMAQGPEQAGASLQSR